MRRVLLAALATAALAPPLAAQAPASFADRLERLDDVRRRAVLRGALVNSGQRCRRVEVAVPQGRYRNLVMWSARCGSGEEYGLFVGPDGSVQVRTCSDLVTLHQPPCRLPPRPPAPRKK